MAVLMKELWKICEGCWERGPYTHLKKYNAIKDLSFAISRLQRRAIIKDNFGWETEEDGLTILSLE